MFENFSINIKCKSKMTEFKKQFSFTKDYVYANSFSKQSRL